MYRPKILNRITKPVFAWTQEKPTSIMSIYSIGRNFWMKHPHNEGGKIESPGLVYYTRPHPDDTTTPESVRKWTFPYFKFYPHENRDLWEMIADMIKNNERIQILSKTIWSLEPPLVLPQKFDVPLRTDSNFTLLKDAFTRTTYSPNDAEDLIDHYARGVNNTKTIQRGNMMVDEFLQAIIVNEYRLGDQHMSRF